MLCWQAEDILFCRASLAHKVYCLLMDKRELPAFGVITLKTLETANKRKVKSVLRFRNLN